MNFSTINPKVAHVIVGVFTAFFFSVVHHPITGLVAVGVLALGKEWGDYLHGETAQSCYFDLAITFGGGLLGVLLAHL